MWPHCVLTFAATTPASHPCRYNQRQPYPSLNSTQQQRPPLRPIQPKGSAPTAYASLPKAAKGSGGKGELQPSWAAEGQDCMLHAYLKCYCQPEYLEECCCAFMLSRQACYWLPKSIGVLTQGELVSRNCLIYDTYWEFLRSSAGCCNSALTKTVHVQSQAVPDHPQQGPSLPSSHCQMPSGVVAVAQRQTQTGTGTPAMKMMSLTSQPWKGGERALPRSTQQYGSASIHCSA